MKKLIQHVFSISLCLVVLNVTAQIRTPKTLSTNKNLNTDASKINNKPNPQIDVTKAKEFFKTLKVGEASSKEGEIKLSVVNDKFPSLNKTTTAKGNPISSAEEICTKEVVKIHVQAQDFQVFGKQANSSWIKPGTIMEAKNFCNGSYAYEQVKERYPIKLSTDLQGINPVFEVQHPQSNSEMNTGIGYFFNAKAKPVSADMSLYFDEVHSLDELGFKLTGKFSAGFGAISAKMDLDYGTKKEAHYYYVIFTQNMFFLEVDGLNPEKIFLDTSIPVLDYVYLSKVHYGRKALIIIKSQSSLEELNLKLETKLSLGVVDASAQLAYNTLVSSSGVEVNAFYYGGDSDSTAESIENTLESGVPDIQTYIKGKASDHTKALPIGYELKNLNNEVVGLESNFTQIVKTCFPKRDYKLKVTLTDIQNINGRDGSDNPDDYGLQQSIVYFSKGREMVTKKENADYNKFSNMINKCTQVPNNINTLLCGDDNNQIQVRQNTNVSERNRSQIKNSIIFSLPYEYYADENASFKIHTWLKEYTSGKDKVLTGNTKISVVNIKYVMDVLSGKEVLNQDNNLADKSIDVTEGGITTKFHNFGNNVLMANIKPVNGKMILDYPIVVGEIGAKAVVWVSFELVN